MILRHSRHPGLIEGVNSGSHRPTYFLTIQGHGVPPQMRDLLNAGSTSETTRTSIHTSHAPIHSNKVNLKGWLWRPHDIRGPCGPKASLYLSYRWGKAPKKPHPEHLSRPGIEPGPAPLQARIYSGGLMKKIICMYICVIYMNWILYSSTRIF